MFWKAIIVSIATCTYLAVADETDLFLSVVSRQNFVSPNHCCHWLPGEYSVHYTIYNQNSTGEAKRAAVSLKKFMHCTSLDNWKKKALIIRFFWLA